ncbi:hypothetical protein DDB_G0289239 [Dictyostelium discoideum AX4]|uniref:Ankyrin repeat-containing protein n=1 Tax=Dictyostelium discoideum TaxID=44689 RepID=Q54HW6_DICDI|nr:hypothetical protein DDB_G0289239 [Dictyostelium discoideum AX4]EAL62853.1 hypothetical protein DDB_G0289239 [Dictyostelium discoideum AX4]|eukprot:XP_636323.1 hypothetical protein DDB_G0289239 [Dictyostelium discoideum AX4]
MFANFFFFFYKLKDSYGKSPIYYIIENNDQKVLTRLLDFSISKKNLTIDSTMLSDLIFNCIVF